MLFVVSLVGTRIGYKVSTCGFRKTSSTRKGLSCTQLLPPPPANYLYITTNHSVTRRDQVISDILHDRCGFPSLVRRCVFGDDNRSYCPDDNDADDATVRRLEVDLVSIIHTRYKTND